MLLMMIILTLLQMLSLICLAVVLSLAQAAPSQLPAGVDAIACPDYPYCTGAAAVPYATATLGSAAPNPLTSVLQAHAEAERRVRLTKINIYLK